jgi:hypothetical protein
MDSSTSARTPATSSCNPNFILSLFGGKPDQLYLVKRVSKTKPDPVYITLSLEQLRDIADRIEHGKRQCAGFIIWLRIRDIPMNELPKGIWDVRR